MNTPTDTAPEQAASSAAPDAPPAPAELYQLRTPGPLKPAVTTGLGLPRQVGGMPAFYYWKDAIFVGTYHHPAGRFSLSITREKLDQLVTTFARMRDNGVKVPILADHAPTAAATLGWIVDVKRRGDRLMELHQFLGPAARDVGLRNQVSLGIDPAFVDGRGQAYGEAIVHSAVTPLPVVPGQAGYEPVPADVDEAEATLTLSLVEPDEAPAEESTTAMPSVVENPAGHPGGSTRLAAPATRFAGGSSASVVDRRSGEARRRRRPRHAFPRGGRRAARAAEHRNGNVGAAALHRLRAVRPRVGRVRHARPPPPADAGRADVRPTAHPPRPRPRRRPPGAARSHDRARQRAVKRSAECRVLSAECAKIARFRHTSCPALALSTQHSHSALSTQHSALSTQHSALSTRTRTQHFSPFRKAPHVPHPLR